MGHKYIDGARPLKRGMSTKSTPWNQEMMKSHKKPTIQSEKQRHNPLLLSLEGKWLMRGWGALSKGKAQYKNAKSCPLVRKIAISMELKHREGFFITWTPNPSARVYQGTIERTKVASPIDGTTLHPSHIDLTLTISFYERFEVLGTHATTPLTQSPAKNLTQETHKPLLPFWGNQLWRPTILAHSFQRIKDQALPLWMSLNLFIVLTNHLNYCNHASPNR